MAHDVADNAEYQYRIKRGNGTIVEVPNDLDNPMSLQVARAGCRWFNWRWPQGKAKMGPYVVERRPISPPPPEWERLGQDY